MSDERSVTGSTVGMSHGFSSPAGAPGVLSASPGGPSASWKPVAVMQPVSCVASNRAQESTVDVSRLTTNMQVSTYQCRELQYVYIETQHGILIVIFNEWLVYAKLCTMCVYLYLIHTADKSHGYLHITAGCEVWRYYSHFTGETDSFMSLLWFLSLHCKVSAERWQCVVSEVSAHVL